jgi:hypothetical protein
MRIGHWSHLTPTPAAVEDPPNAPDPPHTPIPTLKNSPRQVCEDAARLLRTIRTPVGVVAVCGRARTGKSFILNQLLGRSAGFRLAHSHRPCTKGLWIWSRPVRLVGPDGQPYHLVSDTQELHTCIISLFIHSSHSDMHVTAW